MITNFSPKATIQAFVFLALCAANLSAQNTPGPSTPQPDVPEAAAERSYVRRFSAGISIGLVPFNTFPKVNVVDKVDGPPVVEKDSAIDPRSNRAGFGITLQAALTERLAIAAIPTYRKFGVHAFVRQFVGTDNSGTPFVDERVESDINEDTTGHFFEVPLLLRIYNIGRHDPGKRWFFEVGPTLRSTSGVATARSTVPAKGDTFKDNVPIPSRKNSIGATAGIGGQFIDDFGIRAIPEFRYTYWVNRAFDSYHAQTRTHQFEIVLTFSF